MAMEMQEEVTCPERLYALMDDLTHRIGRCRAEACGTCKLDDQLHEMLFRFILAGEMVRPGDTVREAVAEVLDPLFREAAASGFEPLTLEQKAEYERKLRGASAVISGKNEKKGGSHEH